MSQVRIYGTPISNYVRSCRMVCVEKGIDYDLEPYLPQTPEILALNPTGKVPAFRHGELLLQESGAIARYLDETFDGPGLQPEDAAGRIQMTLWMSLIADSFYQVMIREIALPRFGLLKASEEAIGSSAKVLEKQLARSDETLGERRYLAGDAMSLADLFLVPIMAWVLKTPEGEGATARHPNLGRWVQDLAARPSFRETEPPGA